MSSPSSRRPSARASCRKRFAACAAFGESLRIRDGRIDVPGGDAARAAWENLVGEKLDRPERFAQRLFEEDRSRLAYLLDVLTHADPAFTSLVFASPDGDALK